MVTDYYLDRRSPSNNGVLFTARPVTQDVIALYDSYYSTNPIQCELYVRYDKVASYIKKSHDLSDINDSLKDKIRDLEEELTLLKELNEP